MEEYLPYIVSIVCAAISGIVTYISSQRQTRAEIQKLVKQHELDLETEKERHRHELELQALSHKHQLEIQEKEFMNRLGSDMMNTVITEAMKLPETRKQISQGMANAGKKRKN